MLNIIFHLILMLLLSSYCLSTWNCSPSFSTNLTCSCTNKSIMCIGRQDDSFDVTSVIQNISSSYHPPGVVDYVVINVENLSLSLNSSLQNLTAKNLKLSSGLKSFHDDIFVGVNRSLVQLNLKENLFPNVPSNALHVLSQLHYLDLSQNRIVSLTQNDFRGLEELKILNLQHNSITLLLHEPFLFLNNLETLQLGYNNIRTLDSNVFNFLGKLNVLDLTSNFLQTLPDDVFLGLSSLQRLVVDGNNISTVENLNFISSVRQLSAVNCSIQGKLEENSLNNLQNLTFLDLSFNLLQVVQTHALSGLRKLEVLNVSNNRIEAIRKTAFSSLVHLQTLNLEENEVMVMETDVFNNLTELKYLNMNNNKLHGFICEYTSDLVSLEVIELQNNQLKVIRSGTFMYSPKLRVLKLDGNNLECTCLASYFMDYLLNNTLLNSSDVDAILCHTPAEHQGKRLVDMDYSSMKCVVSSPCKSSFLSDDDYDYYGAMTTITESTTEVFSTTLTSTTELANFTGDSFNQTSELSSTTTYIDTTTANPFSSRVSISGMETSTMTTGSTTTESSTAVVTLSTTNTPPTATEESTTVSLPTTAADPVKPIVTTKANISIHNHTLTDAELCIDWTIASEIYAPISCSVSDKVKKITKRLVCPKSVGDLERYCEDDVADNSKICIKVYLTATNKLIGVSCFVVNEFYDLTSDSGHPSSTGIHESTTEGLKRLPSEVDTLPKPFNFTYINIVALNSSASRIEWQVNKLEPTRVCHLNLSISSDSRQHKSMLFPCKDDSVAYEFQRGVTYDICLTANHIKVGVIRYCHRLSHFHQEASATHGGYSSDSTFPIAVLVGLLIIAVCIIILLVVRSILRKHVASDTYNVYDQEQKVRRRESRQKSGQPSVRYSYTRTESIVT